MLIFNILDLFHNFIIQIYQIIDIWNIFIYIIFDFEIKKRHSAPQISLPIRISAST